MFYSYIAGNSDTGFPMVVCGGCGETMGRDAYTLHIKKRMCCPSEEGRDKAHQIMQEHMDNLQALDAMGLFDLDAELESYRPSVAKGYRCGCGKRHYLPMRLYLWLLRPIHDRRAAKSKAKAMQALGDALSRMTGEEPS